MNKTVLRPFCRLNELEEVMKRMSYLILLSGALLLGFSGGTLAEHKATSDPVIVVVLSGGAEVPGPGDMDGVGKAAITLKPDKGELCFELSVKDIQKATSAHIHSGALGMEGDVKVTLKPPSDGDTKDCVSVDKALLNDIATNPGNYYINVHNAEFPKGAIRGQLGK